MRPRTSSRGRTTRMTVSPTRRAAAEDEVGGVADVAPCERGAATLAMTEGPEGHLARLGAGEVGSARREERPKRERLERRVHAGGQDEERVSLREVGEGLTRDE